MRKFKTLVSILLIIVITIGGNGCMSRLYHSPREKIVAYLNDKYDDEFEFYSPYGGSAGSKTTQIYCTSKKYPDVLVWASYSHETKQIGDNYLYIKYSQQYDEFIIDLLSEAFPSCDLEINRNVCLEVNYPIEGADDSTTFVEFLNRMTKTLELSAYIDISNYKFNKDVAVENIEESLKEHNYYTNQCDIMFVYDVENKINQNNDDDNSLRLKNEQTYYLKSNINSGYELINIEWS